MFESCQLAVSSSVKRSKESTECKNYFAFSKNPSEIDVPMIIGVVDAQSEQVVRFADAGINIQTLKATYCVAGSTHSALHGQSKIGLPISDHSVIAIKKNN